MVNVNPYFLYFSEKCNQSFIVKPCVIPIEQIAQTTLIARLNEKMEQYIAEGREH